MQKAIFLNLLAALVIAAPSFAQEKQIIKPDNETSTAEIEKVYAKIESDSEMAPFWYCFNQGLNMSVGQIAEQAKDQPDYYFKLLMLGGFSGIGDRARNACNKTLDEKDLGKSNSDAGKRINQFFISLLIREDIKLYQSCEKKPFTQEWKAAKAYCFSEKMKFEKKLESLL